jgi:hypothetical protein
MTKVLMDSRRKRFYECAEKYGNYGENWPLVKRQLERSEAFKGRRLPTHDEMDVLEEHRIPCSIELEIRSAVIELNNMGFRTAGSCSGHVDVMGSGRGFVSIDTPPAYLGKEERYVISKVLKKHGARNIRIENHGILRKVKGRMVNDTSPDSIHGWVGFTFSPVKQVKAMRARTVLDKAKRMITG